MKAPCSRLTLLSQALGSESAPSKSRQTRELASALHSEGNAEVLLLDDLIFTSQVTSKFGRPPFATSTDDGKRRLPQFPRHSSRFHCQTFQTATTRLSSLRHLCRLRIAATQQQLQRLDPRLIQPSSNHQLLACIAITFTLSPRRAFRPWRAMELRQPWRSRMRTATMRRPRTERRIISPAFGLGMSTSSIRM